METQKQFKARISEKVKKAAWPADVEDPSVRPELQLSNENAFLVVGRARRAGLMAGWSDEQVVAFTKLATAGDYDHVLQTCMKYFDVR